MKRALAVLLLLAASACKDTTSSGEPVASVELATEVVGVGVNDTVTVGVTVRNANQQIIQRDVTWRSLNTSVVTVNDAGRLRGVAPGTTRVVASAGGRADTAEVIVATGTLRTFNVNSNEACDLPISKVGRQVAATGRVAIFEDITNPAGGPTPAQYQQVAATVESVVYDVNVANFGAPTDIDGNGRIVVLYTRAVNELTPRNAGFVVGGFHYARDLFPRQASNGLDACPASNVAEMFYLLAADPNGVVNGNARSVSYVLGTTVGVVAHEFQHVINASRRLHVLRTPNWEETVWLNEGLSHIAEELTFYAASGRAPRTNLTLVDVTAPTVEPDFLAYGVANLDRFDEYLRQPSGVGPFQDNDDLETRGATWALLRYAADRHPGADQALWNGLVNSSLLGLQNLESALGADPTLWARDWAVANYSDDAVAGIPARFTHPSWNFRSIMSSPRYGGYPLQVIPLASGAAVSRTIRAGSAAYFRFGVAPAATGDVRVSLRGTTVIGACTPVTLAPGEVFQGTAAAASAVCLPGGASGAEYALVTSFAARDTNGQSANANTGVTVVGMGIQMPTAPPSPWRGPAAAASTTLPRGRVVDGGFEGRLRRREREQLGGRVHRGGAPAPSLQMDPAAPGVWVNIVRVR